MISRLPLVSRLLASLRAAVALGTVCIAAVGCASQTEEEGESDDSALSAPRVKPLLVLLGGYNSCESTPTPGSPLAFPARSPEYVTLLRAATEKNLLDVASTCFGPTKDGTGVELRVLGPDAYDLNDIARVYVYPKEQAPTLAQLEVAIKTVKDVITRATDADGGTRPVVIVGHSHGGWLALKLADHLPAKVNLRALVTVDPISPLKCSASNAFRAIVGLSAIPTGCIEAPADIDVATQKKISERTVWQHYYQTQYSKLHSGPFTGIPGERSVLVVAPKAGLLTTEHSTIAQDPELWYERAKASYPTIESVVRRGLTRGRR